MTALTLFFGTLLASLVNLDHPGHYFHWGFIAISYANLIVIGAMVVVFCLAIALPFKSHKSKGGSDEQ